MRGGASLYPGWVSLCVFALGRDSRRCGLEGFIQGYEVTDVAVGWCFAFEPPGRAIVRVRNPKRLAWNSLVGFAMEADGWDMNPWGIVVVPTNAGKVAGKSDG